MERNVSFFRQVPYLSSWKVKEINSLVYKCKSKTFETLGHVIAKEGAPADKVFFIAAGEVEFVKTDLQRVFFNERTGIVAVQEQKVSGQDEKLLKSTTWLLKEDEEEQILSGSIAYRGTEFAQNVHAYLRSFINTKVTFKDKHRSQFNQRAFKEIKVGVFGPGLTFGDQDTFNDRKYLYTMRTKTSRVTVWEIGA